MSTAVHDALHRCLRALTRGRGIADLGHIAGLSRLLGIAAMTMSLAAAALLAGCEREARRFESPPTPTDAPGSLRISTLVPGPVANATAPNPAPEPLSSASAPLSASSPIAAASAASAATSAASAASAATVAATPGTAAARSASSATSPSAAAGASSASAAATQSAAWAASAATLARAADEAARAIRGATQDPSSPAAAPRPPYPAAREFQDNAYAVSQGKRWFRWYNCNGCHANGGGGSGPPLMDDQWRYGHSPEQVVASILQGRPNGMPSFAGRIPEDQAWQLAAYVRSMAGLLRTDVASGRSDSLSSGVPESRREPWSPKAGGQPPGSGP